MSGTCLSCGHVSSASPQASPPNPSHCGHCPPWTCEDCGETCSATDLCKCWTSFEGMAVADIKGLFAAAGVDVSPPYPSDLKGSDDE